MSVVIQDAKHTLADVPNMKKKLPSGNYILNRDPRTGEYFLTKIAGYKVPKKLYGDFHEVKVYFKSYFASKTNTGILFRGLKGTGKTIIAKLMAIYANKKGIPVINISSGYSGIAFLDFMARPEIRDAVIFIDEFEKVYPKVEENPDILSLMSGQFDSHHMYVLTSNSKVADLLTNRPGRIEFLKVYESLSAEQIKLSLKIC